VRAARVLAIGLAAASLALGACGGSGGSAPSATVPGNADPADVAVIKAWVDALRRGDVAKAASYFAIPSVVQNGGPPLRVGDRRSALLFNASLPCGARLVRAVRRAPLTIASFRLTERPGPGSCGAGVGGLAKVGIRVSGGKIVQWRRVPLGRAPTTPGTAL
jgi:limonene-1,2-epoxide hydrolase